MQYLQQFPKEEVIETYYRHHAKWQRRSSAGNQNELFVKLEEVKCVVVTMWMTIQQKK